MQFHLAYYPKFHLFGSPNFTLCLTQPLIRTSHYVYQPLRRELPIMFNRRLTINTIIRSIPSPTIWRNPNSYPNFTLCLHRHGRKLRIMFNPSGLSKLPCGLPGKPVVRHRVWSGKRGKRSEQNQHYISSRYRPFTNFSSFTGAFMPYSRMGKT